jgi:hypothetical protein
MTEATPATQAWLADAVAAVHLTNRARERQQLIQDLAATNPLEWNEDLIGNRCIFCLQPSADGILLHTETCLWYRANRLTEETPP